MQEMEVVAAAGKKARRSAAVVGQDKESASQYRATTDFHRFFRSFPVGRSDARASVWRASCASQYGAVNTAPRGARRKPCGRPQRIAAAVVIGFISVAVPAALGRFFRLRITLTDSAAPAGIYREVAGVAPDRGALVAACLPPAIARTGLARGYLRQGNCPAGAEPVAKVIGALPGDVVTVERGQAAINGVPITNSQTSARDSAGRLLPHEPWGARQVAPGEVWLFGFNDPRSWDARYFGPVPLAGVRGVLRPVLTW